MTSLRALLLLLLSVVSAIHSWGGGEVASAPKVSDAFFSDAANHFSTLLMSWRDTLEIKNCMLLLKHSGLIVWSVGRDNSTSTFATACYATLEKDNGVLRLWKDPLFVPRRQLWESTRKIPIGGAYVLALQESHHNMGVYGPVVWAEGPAHPPYKAATSSFLTVGERLPAGGYLTAGRLTLRMGLDCNLVLMSGVELVLWESGTSGKGKGCTTTLQIQRKHRVQLVISSDSGLPIWSATSHANRSTNGYVTILQNDGRVVTYGPTLWTAR